VVVLALEEGAYHNVLRTSRRPVHIHGVPRACDGNLDPRRRGIEGTPHTRRPLTQVLVSRYLDCIVLEQQVEEPATRSRQWWRGWLRGAAAMAGLSCGCVSGGREKGMSKGGEKGDTLYFI
jgi:hypothetical protein